MERRRKWAISFVTSIQRDGFSSSVGWKSDRIGEHRPRSTLFFPPPSPEEKQLLANDGCTVHDSIYVTGARPGMGVGGYDKFPVYKLISESINYSPPPVTSRPLFVLQNTRTFSKGF